MKLVNKETGMEVEYIEGQSQFNPEIWELVEGEYNLDDMIDFDDKKTK